VLTSPQGGPQALDRIADRWNAKRGGVENQHKVAVVAGDVKFEPLAFTQSDAEFLGQRELSAREVARIFRVPAWAITRPPATA